jgi:hypothetical protein
VPENIGPGSSGPLTAGPQTDQRAAMRMIVRRHPYLTFAFLLSTLAALWFLVDFLLGVLFWDGKGHEKVAPWMTVGYVARAWDLVPQEIDAAAGLPLPVDGRPFTLQEIADDRGVPVAEIVALVEKTVRDMKRREHQGQD